MDALKRAIRNSPAMVRRKLGRSHDKLQDDWLNSNDAVVNGVTFYVKYVGWEAVSAPQGPAITEEAVFNIKARAKSREKRGEKLHQLSMTVSSSCLRLAEKDLCTVIDDIPIYRISYCTVYRYDPCVVAYIFRNSQTKKLECHAFRCSSKSKAQAITLSVAQAFNIAFETWEASKTRRAQQKAALKRVQNEEAAKKKASQDQIPIKVEIEGQPALPISEEGESAAPAGLHASTSSMDSGHPSSPALSPAGEIDDELDVEFSQLARARSNPHLLNIGDVDMSLAPEDILDFRGGESNASDLSRTISHDDLLSV